MNALKGFRLSRKKSNISFKPSLATAKRIFDHSKVFRELECKGSATVEYAIILPLAFACVFAVVCIFFSIYQQSLLQSLAEDAAESMARQWGYDPLPVDQINTGAYEWTTFKNREIYWNLKALVSDKKEAAIQSYVEERAKTLGLLKLLKDVPLTVTVAYSPGLPSMLQVNITARYQTVGAGVLKLLGIGEVLELRGRAETAVYDPKEMINTTDYVVQLFRQSKTFESFQKLVAPVKGILDKITSQ
ncbi:MAG: pilus assembly protein [Clostridia bacterium]|nr:pilus assembly protein [Clostridia bacterium]